jgi:MFS family permease
MGAGVKSDKDFYGWTNVVVTVIMGLAGGIYLISFSIFLPFLVKDFGWSRSLISLGSTINLFVLGICGPLAGVFIVKHGARWSIVMGNCLGCLGLCLLFTQKSLWQLFLGHGLLIGIGAGFGGLLATTTVINDWFVKKRSVALSCYLGSFSAGGLIIGPSMTALINWIGWRYTYLVMAGVIFLLSILVPAIFIRNKPEDLGQVPDGPDTLKPDAERKPVSEKASYKTPVDFTMREAVRTRSLWLLIIYFCCNMLVMQALLAHQFAHLLDLGIPAIVASFAFAVMSVVMTATQFGAGFLGFRFSMHSIAIASEVLKIIAMVFLVLTDTLPFVFVYMVIFGLGFGGAMVATMNIFPNYFGTTYYPKIMGFVRLFWTFAGGAGAPLAGLVSDTTGSYLPAFRIAIFGITIGLIFLIFATPPVHPSLTKTSAAVPQQSGPVTN